MSIAPGGVEIKGRKEIHKKSGPRLTVCLDSLNSTYLEEWAYA